MVLCAHIVVSVRHRHVLLGDAISILGAIFLMVEHKISHYSVVSTRIVSTGTSTDVLVHVQMFSYMLYSVLYHRGTYVRYCTAVLYTYS